MSHNSSSVECVRIIHKINDGSDNSDRICRVAIDESGDSDSIGGRTFKMISARQDEDQRVVPTPDAMTEPLTLKVLRALPPFRGKARIARRLLTSAQKTRGILIRDHFGNRIVIPNLMEPVGFALGVNGTYEPAIVTLLRQHLQRELDFVDVGANIGAFTVALARHARHVVAIEASPVVAPFLRRNVELSGYSNVAIVECPVSAPGIEDVPFFIPPMDHFGMGSSAAQFGVKPILLEARTLDRILSSKDSGRRVGAMKVDVEGFEAHVFLGAQELLHSPRAPFIAFEFCDWAEERAFPGRRGWAQQVLMEAGYKIWTLHSYRRNSAPLAKPITEGSHDLIARRV